MSCHKKQILHTSYREINDTNLKLQYKRYCKILTNVIKTAQQMYYDKLISKSNNKTKTTWKIIKKETGKNNCQNYIKSLNINDTKTNVPHEIANKFNDYFLTVTDTVRGNIKKENNDPRDNMNPSNYFINKFNSTFPIIKWNYATTYEIDKIIKSLKTKNS